MELKSIHDIVLICVGMYLAIATVLWYFKKAVCFKMVPKELVGPVIFMAIIMFAATVMDYSINGDDAYKHVIINMVVMGVGIFITGLAVLAGLREHIKGDF